MLFLIIQTHTPENCPIDKPQGAHSYHTDPKDSGVKLLGIWRGGPNHEIYYLVEGQTHASLEKFLKPGFKKTVSQIIPVEKMV